jgi:O-antigen/teichoic acid export membrane protein
VVVPTWTGEVTRLLASLERQTFRNFTLEVVKRVAPAGRARNLGAAATRSTYILFVDDDAFFADEHVLARLVETLERDPAIGVAGPSKLIPLGASGFQHRVGREVPRWVYPEVEVDTETNPPLDRYGFSGVTTACCLIRRSTFEALGGFDEQLTTAEDTEFFFRLRSAGYRFVVPAHCVVYHDPPATLAALVRKHFRYGYNHALEAERTPQRRMWIVPLNRWYGLLLLLFSPLLFLPSLFVNLYFDPKRALSLGWRPLKAVALYATFYGYSWSWLRLRGQVVSAEAGRPPSSAPPAGSTAAPAPTAVAPMASPIAAVNAVQGSLAMLASFAAIAILNYAFAIVMSWTLSIGQFGVLGVVQAILVLGATVVGSGFPWALARVVAQHPPSDHAARAVRSALLGNLALALVLVPALIGAAQAGWLGLSPGYVGHMVLVSATIVVLAVGQVFGAVLQGQRQLLGLGLVRSLEVGAKLVAGTALVLAGGTALEATAGFLVGALVASALAIALVRGLPLLAGRGWIDRSILATTGPLFLGVFGLAAVVQVDIIGLHAFGSAEIAEILAGEYQAAVTLARIPVFVTLALFSAVFPFVAQAGGSRADANRYALPALKYTLLFVVPLNVVLTAIPDQIIRFFFSPDYDRSAGPLALASAGSALMVLVHALVILLQALGRISLPALLLPVMVALELAVQSVLVPELESEGAALSLCLAGLAGLTVLVPAFRREFGVWPSARSTASYVGSLALLWLTLVTLAPDGRGSTGLTVLLGGAVYLLALLASGLIRRNELVRLGAGLRPDAGLFGHRLGRLAERLALRSAGVGPR